MRGGIGPADSMDCHGFDGLGSMDVDGFNERRGRQARQSGGARDRRVARARQGRAGNLVPRPQMASRRRAGRQLRLGKEARQRRLSGRRLVFAPPRHRGDRRVRAGRGRRRQDLDRLRASRLSRLSARGRARRTRRADRVPARRHRRGAGSAQQHPRLFPRAVELLAGLAPEDRPHRRRSRCRSPSSRPSGTRPTGTARGRRSSTRCSCRRSTCRRTPPIRAATPPRPTSWRWSWRRSCRTRSRR